MNIALVGRTNVGKSTIFNRLYGQNKALVYDEPGVTRDCRREYVHWFDLHFYLFDTPGFFDEHLPVKAQDHVKQVIDQSDLILFVVETRLYPNEVDIARYLRQQGKTVILLINKEDRKDLDIVSFYELGFDDIIPVSAEHNTGFDGLYETLKRFVPTDALEITKRPRIAIMGRPNAGKSTFINLLIGQAKQLTGDMPGLTRESIAYDLEEYPLTLVDTPGVANKNYETLEQMMLENAKKTMNYADAVIYLISGMPTHYDQTFISEVLNEGRCLTIALSKWDETQEQNATYAENAALFCSKAPIVRLSSFANMGTDTILKTVMSQLEKTTQKISTGKLNKWLNGLAAQCPYGFKAKYMTQINAKPPKFLIFINRKHAKFNSYKRYLINQMVKNFDFLGVPVRVVFKTSSNPFSTKNQEL